MIMSVTLIGATMVQELPRVEGLIALGIEGLTTRRLLRYLRGNRVRITTPIVILAVGECEQIAQEGRTVPAILRTLRRLCDDIERRFPCVERIHISEIIPRQDVPWRHFNQQLATSFPLVFRATAVLVRNHGPRPGVMDRERVRLSQAGQNRLCEELGRFVRTESAPL